MTSAPGSGPSPRDRAKWIVTGLAIGAAFVIATAIQLDLRDWGLVSFAVPVVLGAGLVYWAVLEAADRGSSHSGRSRG